ncbi:hypothetical protein EBU71_09305 [bacterium]|nr:hypothetical protein [Candidatus Elulimicrobium humile]
MTAKSIGREGFVWFIGTVEDRNDPLQLGRVKVRALNFHSENKALVPTSEIPWAIIQMPPTESSFNKVGRSPTGITVGSTVVGFFIDGNDANYPVITGTIHGIPENNIQKHDVTELARGINSLKKNYDSYEPSSAYASKYPYNKVLQTERGIVVEIDDTPGEERIHIYHPSGTYKEINKEGRQVDKITGNKIEVVLGTSTVHIVGNVNIQVDGNYTMNVNGDVAINGRTINLNNGTMGAARIGDVADTGDPGGAVGSNVIESGSSTVFIGG